MPPGPELATVLAGLELARIPNGQVVDVLRAQARQLAHEQARLLDCLLEVGRSDPDDLHGVQRRPEVSEWAGAEIAAALTLTGVAADRELDFAETMITRLPVVHAALSSGSIDRAKGWVFADHLAEVPAQQIAVICSALVPLASGLTTGQLRARLVRMLHDIDPDHARRRYRRAVRERGVIAYLQPNGTVTITASGLPTDEAALACERLDTLARAVQRAGHPACLAQIQADLFLGMLEGRFHHHTEQQIITALLHQPRPEDTVDAEPADQGSNPTDATTAATETANGATANWARGDHRADSAPGAGDPADGDPAGGDPADSDPAGGDPADSATADSGTEDAGTGDAGTGAADDAVPRAQPPFGVEIRVGLGTLLGLDEQCGEIPGLGPVIPGVARALIAAQHHGAQWRFAITDPDGMLLLAGITRRRPGRPVGERGRCRGGVVELHVSLEALTRLAAAPAEGGPWAGVIADLAAQYTDRDRLLDLLDQHPGDRFARDALARHVEVRDRTCCFPGCRRPARTSDKDHTLDHATGGPTTSGNTGPLCERHHRYKTEGWWHLVQPRPGRFRWRSPLARVYRTRGEPIRPPTVPPHPRRPTRRADTEPARPVTGPILRRPPRRPSPPPHGERSATEPPPF